MTAFRALLFAVAISLAWGPQSMPVMRLVEPTADTILTGSVVFRVAVTGGTLRQVEFQVDGVEACRATAPPFECRWNAGSRVTPRVVRAVGTLDDGSRLTSSIKTRGVTVSDSSQVDSVLITARVTDSRGRFVPGLTAADFRVLDEGVVQSVTLVAAGDDGAEVVIALDASGSMGVVVDDLKEVVRDFLDRLRPMDKVTLAAFDSAFIVLADRDADRAARSLAIANLTTSGGTAIFDSIIQSTEILADHPGRRVVVLFTDGEDMSSRSTIESARAALDAEDTMLYLVATGKAETDVALRRSLTDLCVETGGAAYFSGRLTGTIGHFREIVDDLSKQYLLAFSPTPSVSDGKWRRLSVELRDRSLRVRARTGYFATKRSGDTTPRFAP